MAALMEKLADFMKDRRISGEAAPAAVHHLLSDLVMTLPNAHAALSAGFKHFFTPRPLDTPRFTVAGIGVHERMPPGLVRRPRGTGDYLFMLFHDPAQAGNDPAPGPRPPHAPETMVIWAPGDGQYYGNDRRPYSHSWIHCDGTAVRRWLRETRLPIGRAFQLAAPALFSRCLLSLHEELASRLPPSPIIASNLFQNGLHEQARALSGGDARPRIEERLVLVRRWIGAAPAHKVTLADLAAMAGMSIPHFCASFKKAFGQAPIDCLIVQRLTHAAHLLADRNLNIASIARLVGYDDPFHFSKAFKRHFGLGPRALRRQRHGG